ncbi:MerR family transcriptional regulator [Paenibacillus lemnae]|uniref:MerR family transcriptional regulator n=1 Tax=Paenibacillus lemnae TaxID=1330551 RepID=UPI001FE642CD|nr:MerR family transcriptional regulator [Paenibacillus lemnae]
MPNQLFRIGELAKAAGISERTIDYYTKLGLITPEKRTLKNYRLYSTETLTTLERINQMKQEKYTLEEIKDRLERWKSVAEDPEVTDKLSQLEIQIQRLEREVNEISPLLEGLKPNQARAALTNILPKGAACIESLQILLSHFTPPM